MHSLPLCDIGRTKAITLLLILKLAMHSGNRGNDAVNTFGLKIRIQER